MPLNPQLSDGGANAAANAVTALLNGGATLRIYDGTQPASANVAVGSQVLLAQLAFATTAFAAAVAGVATANAIAATNALANGTATWFRAVASGGAAIFDGSVGTSGANLIVNTTTFLTGIPVSVNSFTYTQRET